MLLIIALAALTGMVLGWALGRTVDTYLETRLSPYPKKTIITVCLIALVLLALFAR